MPFNRYNIPIYILRYWLVSAIRWLCTVLFIYDFHSFFSMASKKRQFFFSCCCYYYILYVACSPPFFSSVNILLYEKNFLYRTHTHTQTETSTHKIILSPLRAAFLVSHTEYVQCICLFFSSILIGKGLLHSIHTTTWLKSAHPASSNTEPLMVTLKFAGAKTCIQFIALDRSEQELYIESTVINTIVINTMESKNDRAESSQDANAM